MQADARGCKPSQRDAIGKARKGRGGREGIKGEGADGARGKGERRKKARHLRALISRGVLFGRGCVRARKCLFALSPFPLAPPAPKSPFMPSLPPLPTLAFTFAFPLQGFAAPRICLHYSPRILLAFPLQGFAAPLHYGSHSVAPVAVSLAVLTGSDGSDTRCSQALTAQTLGAHRL